ncbi:MAG TPA: DUF2239 family protein [Spirochaetia bacterium]|nr:DUF2239 family protein [Spirochaetia bacterium]
MKQEHHFTAFVATHRAATGTLPQVLEASKRARDADPGATLLLFDNRTGRQLDFDLTGTVEDVVARAASGVEKKGRGRPRLGVDCGELCLLPRHWEWLSAQPRSASATIRRLIDAARKAETPEDQVRERVDATSTFMWAMAGDLPNFEEASRALYQHDWDSLRELIGGWPVDIRDHIEFMLAPESE